MISKRRLIPLTVLAALACVTGCKAPDDAVANRVALRPTDFAAAPTETTTSEGLTESESAAPAAPNAPTPPSRPRPARQSRAPAQAAAASSPPPSAAETAREPQPAMPSVAPSPPAPKPAARPVPEPTMPEPADDSYTVDAMVGQVNGRPIYAGDVFKRIGEPQFVNLGQSLPRLEFRQEASRLVAAHLRDIIANSMILAEAEQSLTEQEQLGLLDLLKKERENIINQFGGFLSGAEQGLKRDRGVTLEEYIESRRQEVLVQKFLRENLWPKIHISRRDVERYYREHYDEYHQPGSVTLRMIVVRNEAAAADVEAALAEGTPFADVASKHSRIRAGQGGLLSEMRLRDGLKRFKGTRWRTLNEAVRKLEKGEHTDRVKIDRGFAWAYVEEIKPPKSIALREVYLEIEQKLKTAEFNRLSQKYLADLMAKGSYTPVDRMAESLVEVAMNRYAQPREK